MAAERFAVMLGIPKGTTIVEGIELLGMIESMSLDLPKCREVALHMRQHKISGAPIAEAEAELRAAMTSETQAVAQLQADLNPKTGSRGEIAGWSKPAADVKFPYSMATRARALTHGASRRRQFGARSGGKQAVMPNKRQQIAEILAGLEPGELDTLASMEPGEIAALVDQARKERETRERLNRDKTFAKIRVSLTVRYEREQEQTGKPGRIIVRGASADPVEIEVGPNQWEGIEGALVLPDGYDGKGGGWWENYSLSPTSGDYAPINWVRFNFLLKSLGSVYGPELSPEEFAALPGKALRSAGRKPEVLAYLIGGQGPGL